jgi:tetratricopeptide (TPR) repeat protein
MPTALLSAWLLVVGASGASGASAPPKPVASPPAGSLHFIENDYPRALAEAKRRQVPVFVDAWAPWCHTCLFLRTTVLDDPGLARFASRFVWLSLDTEQASSEAFLERVPISSWPTLLILDPMTSKPVLKWLGNLSVGDLATFLEIGEARVRKPADAATPAAEASPIDPLLARRAHEPASRLGATEALVVSLQEQGAFEACARAAATQSPALPRAAAFASAVTAGLYCAVAAPDPAPWRPSALTVLEPLGEEALKIPDLQVDDRSSVYEALVDVREKRGDKASARTLAAAWFAFLSGEYARAGDPEARAAFDAHLVLAALAMGEPQKALPALLASERDLPKDYNAAAREALVYRELQRYPEALAAIDRALTQATGPRRLRLLEIRSSICAKMGDAAGARAALVEALHFGEALPKGQRSEKALAHVRVLLAELN